MHILTLQATFHSLTFHAFRSGIDEAVLESDLSLAPSDQGPRWFPADVLWQVRHALQDIGLPGPDAIAPCERCSGANVSHNPCLSAMRCCNNSNRCCIAHRCMCRN